MKIAVLGTGNVGGTLGKRWAQIGHQVAFGSRDPNSDKVKELLDAAGENAQAVSPHQAVKDAEVTVLATPWKAAQQMIESIGNWEGRILIDCVNALNDDFTGLDLGHTTSAAEEIATWAKGAKVIKAFNTASTCTMADPLYGDQKATLFYCGDDPQAKSIVGSLIEQLDFEAVDAGPLKNARYLEPLAMLYIHLAMREGWGTNCAFKIMKR